jgi:hypothetical protein
MKKLLVLSAVMFGTVVASRAGVDIRIGLPLPPLPHIVIGHHAPRVVVHAPPVCAPPPRVVYAPAPVVYAPPPRVVYAPVRHGRGHYREHRHGHHHHGYCR